VNVEQLIAHYGLVAVFLGAGIEGETAVVTGGVLAHQGLLSPVGAGLAAMAGSFVADQGFFHVGRYYREGAIVRRLRDKPAYAKAMDFFERHPRGFVFAYRFIYGIRTVSPIAIGTSGISTRLFVAVNVAAAIVWGALFTTIGYLFGNVVERAVGRIAGDRAVWLVAGLVVAAVVLGLALRWWWKRGHPGKTPA
jgi:membrane protein DedA with SNARE-associated domain